MDKPAEEDSDVNDERCEIQAGGDNPDRVMEGNENHPDRHDLLTDTDPPLSTGSIENLLDDIPPIRHSTRIPQPTAIGATMRNIPYISRTERTVQDIRAASNRNRHLREEEEFNANFMEDLALTSIIHEEEDPKSITKALSRPNGPMWNTALQSELKSMKDHHVWDLIPRSSLPIGKKVIKSKTICHIKRDQDGNMAKLKACIVAKGFTQVAGEDYHDTFSPIGCMESFCLLLSMAVTLDWELRQLDVKTAFLHSELDEEIYMEQPEGGVVKGLEDHVCKLQKGIYRLKQAGRQWNKMLDKTMLKHGFKRIPADHCLYMRITLQGKSIVAVHTDDMAVGASTPSEMDSIIHDLRSTFDITDLGDIRWILGVEISRDRNNRTISLCQSTYIERIIK